jgi:hypothetical protein
LAPPLVIQIAISQAALEAIARTLPLGNVSFENKTDEEGRRLIWLDKGVVDRLRAMRGPGESYSDVILRLVGMTRAPHSLAHLLFPPSATVLCSARRG